MAIAERQKLLWHDKDVFSCDLYEGVSARNETVLKNLFR